HLRHCPCNRAQHHRRHHNSSQRPALRHRPLLISVSLASTAGIICQCCLPWSAAARRRFLFVSCISWATSGRPHQGARLALNCVSRRSIPTHVPYLLTSLLLFFFRSKYHSRANRIPGASMNLRTFALSLASLLLAGQPALAQKKPEPQVVAIKAGKL